MAATDVYSWKEVAKIWKSQKPVYRDTATGDFYTAAGERPQGSEGSAHRPVSELQCRAWMKAGRAGCSTISVSPTPACTMPTCKPATCAQRFDAIVIPDQTAQQIAQGHRAGTMPPEYCGGSGDKGAAALKEFVEQGGTLILFNHASDYARRCSA